MKRTFTTKIQKIVPQTSNESKLFSTVLVIEPENDAVNERKGTLYVVFDLTDTTPVDSLLVTKLANDVMHNAYYQSDNASLLQALELAVVAVKDKLTKLSNTQQAKLNILSAVLWGNVVYLVQYGQGGCFLMRDRDLRPINTATEGSFSIASGVVKDGDVIIIATSVFLQKYSAQQLVSTAAPISSYDLSANAAALIMKFSVDTAFSEAETISFDPAARTLPKVESMSGVKTIPYRMKLSSGPRFAKPLLLLIPVVAALLGFSIFFTMKNNKQKSAPKVESAAGSPAQGRDSEPSIGPAPTFFYDLKLANENVSTSEIAVVGDKLVVSDKIAGAVYVSQIATPKFEAIATAFPGVRSIAEHEDTFVFTDNEGFKAYSLASDKVVAAYEKTGLGESASYLDFVYDVTGDTITKYTKQGATLSGSVWNTSANLTGAVAIAIDGNIYVLKGTGDLLKFYQGEKVEFAVGGLDKPFVSPVDVVTNSDLKNVYVADAGNKRVVVLDKTGKVTQQIFPAGDVFADIKDVAVSDDETKLFVLSDTKVYEVSLQP